MSLVRVTKPVGNQGRQLRAPAAGRLGTFPSGLTAAAEPAGRSQPRATERSEVGERLRASVCVAFSWGDQGLEGCGADAAFP